MGGQSPWQREKWTGKAQSYIFWYELKGVLYYSLKGGKYYRLD